MYQTPRAQPAVVAARRTPRSRSPSGVQGPPERLTLRCKLVQTTMPLGIASAAEEDRLLMGASTSRTAVADPAMRSTAT
jgi:hypothetical protein